VALDVGGVRFEGTLNKKYQDYTNKNCKWQVKANLRGQSFGEVNLKAKIKKATLGQGFNLAGALPGADAHDVVTVNIPVRVEIAGRVFEVPIESDFKFSGDGKRATGSGEGP
jgi:hypothetical protein